MLLRARSNGEWGNDLRADVRGIANADGDIVRVSLRLLREGAVVETFSDLQVAPGEPDDLFDTINRQSRFVVAVDPGFADAIPKEGTFAFDDDRHADRDRGGGRRPEAAAPRARRGGERRTG